MCKAWSILLGLIVVVGCDGGGTGGEGGGEFRLIEFLERNQSNIERNRSLTFLFSGLVRPDQDFAQRLKIQSVKQEPGADFTLAIGDYVPSGDRVMFIPRLPNLADRSDAGLRENGNYSVFVKGGPDALESADGHRVVRPQEFVFVTSEFFEDIVPQQPPRVLGFIARDPGTQATFDLGRLDPRPAEVALEDSATLIANGRYIDPGAGGPPTFATPWRFELVVSEPLDPATVSADLVQMFEVYSNATTSAPEAAPDAPPGYMGTAVQYRVPLKVSIQQGVDAQGNIEARLVVTPIYTLVDDTRYRITFAGSILGLDFRKEFIGANGLTGDGQTILSGGTPYDEPGGLGYTTEFLVADRASITQKRTLTYDPLADNIQPELGQTVADEDRYNSALYNPAINPGTAVGFLSAFGQGTDGNLAVASGTLTIDTGDTANPTVSTFQVFDLNPNNDYHTNPLPGGLVTYDNPEPFDLQLSSLTISSGATLKFVGKNPPIVRVRGVAQISGTLDVSGDDGAVGGGSVAAGGAGGVGGFTGGNTKRPAGACTGYCPGGANDFIVYLNSCAVAAQNAPHSLNGLGPGRGYAGGTGYTYDYSNDLTQGGGTGGGGASHATKGGVGEDVKNTSGATGTGGNPTDTNCGVRPDGVIGVRGQAGPTYGDRELAVILLGGSGGGGGGSMANWNTPKTQAGGSGGGGGGSISIVASGAILVSSGGVINATGGTGGNGRIVVQSQPNSWQSTSGGGGGGAGGSISLISGDAITVTGGLLDARGGAGGLRSDVGTGLSCNACNAGGPGGKGYIFLMDADGQIAGLLPGTPGNYDGFTTGVLTISEFDATRFSSIAAVTELFPALTANPAYDPMTAADVLALCNPSQKIHLWASSAKADINDPLKPNIVSETTPVEVAVASSASGGTVIDPIPGAMAALNPGGTPARDAFIRIEARFEYASPVEAALGPFAYIDRVDVTITFNG
ncbi:MAG TPA: hypothetical protein VFY93_18510 [Planctomycetota bacterium]|nr:hypothetical protein [Planctomycetota bacterium]